MPDAGASIESTVSPAATLKKERDPKQSGRADHRTTDVLVAIDNMRKMISGFHQ
jgi:hypothetical protein